MHQPLPAIHQFLHTYAADSAAANPSAVVAHFADTFLAAAPDGARPVRAADFALALPERKRLFDKLGCQPAELLSVQPTPLDNRYVLAATEWRMRFERPDLPSQDVIARSTFLIDTGSIPFRILLYLAHQDILAVLRDRGILTT